MRFMILLNIIKPAIKKKDLFHLSLKIYLLWLITPIAEEIKNNIIDIAKAVGKRKVPT